MPDFAPSRLPQPASVPALFSARRAFSFAAHALLCPPIAAAIVFVAAAAARAGPPATSAQAEPVIGEQVETSPSSSCSEIHQELSRLARAERDQALALQLFSRGAGAPIVQARLQELQEVSADLRETLRRVHASRIANDSSVSECLKLGYQSLFAAEKVTSEVERVLIQAHGEPLAGF
jgi:hypothetical protein